MNRKLARVIPSLEWAAGYNRGFFASDMLAAVIVTIMLIPQSLAYALLAGLPAEMGLYASILPLVAYALLGSGTRVIAGGSRCSAREGQSTAAIASQRRKTWLPALS